ncbi:MAG: TIR domain-containing protein [Cyanobacteria bacterium P01_B01_bin.77]
MNPFQDVFISYGRADSRDFAAKLNQRLIETGLEVWFDFDDIPLGVNYQKQIDDGIQKADNFIFIISPHSVNSPYCGKEIELALACNKRIIPLLHVEEISHETWQKRNPDANERGWHAIKEKGIHSSFPNMHPEISKINWVYMREGVDDFGKSFQDLLDLCQRDKSYVHQHTILLNQALTWEENHKQPKHLLVETELHKAETWLKTSFQDRQPPCTPNKLQCQFISESSKNTQNGMTQVFLSHAEEDRDTLEVIYDSLTRVGLTVWTNWRDIQTGTDFKASINQGIEAADNVVYLLSPSALKSTWCQYELDYARSLHKRILPVLAKPVDLDTLPDYLKTLQFIDLTDNKQESDYLNDESELLKALSKDAEYYRTHKLLLTKALKWEEQLKNPSILLRGQALRQTEVWLKIAQKHTSPPLPVQTEFVQASLEQPTDARLGVFIASDARDLNFSHRLNDKLQIQGESTWFEPDKAILGPEYDSQVKTGIEQAENFLFIVSEDALVDAATLEELKLAESLSKRIIAVSYRNVDRSQVPSALANGIWVAFSSIHGEDFTTDFETLYRILKSHPNHVRDHTQLLIRASVWEQAEKDDSTLLRGKDLKRAEQWYEQAQTQTPKPSELQIAYIKASQELPFRKVKKRSILGLSMGVTLLVMVARILGLFEGLELLAYDHLLRQRPNEPQDDRFLIVTVDDQTTDFFKQKVIVDDYQAGLGTIPDAALSETLEVLAASNPRLIGLDFYRDFPAQPVVGQALQTTDNLIAICKSSYDSKGITPPPEVDIDRVGFNNFVTDATGNIALVRRQYLVQPEDPTFCNTPVSFSMLLTDRYLQQEGTFNIIPTENTIDLQIEGTGSVKQASVLLLDKSQSGPYVPSLKKLGGFQTLLNFRTAKNSEQSITKDPSQFAPSVSLEALLQNQVATELIEDRIVLIGYVDAADRNADYWSNPYGGMAGVFVQGQMTSQLISAVLDDRPLIRWLSLWQEVLWVAGWAVVGGVIVRQVVRSPRLGVGLAAGGLLLYGSCYGSMVYCAFWVPLILPFAAFSLTAGGGILLSYRLRHG